MNRVKLLLRIADAFHQAAAADGWDEEKHNRDENGRFSSNESKSDSGNENKPVRPTEPNQEDAAHPEDISQILGEEFKGYKGTGAINKLLTEKRGYIKAAFRNETFGDIALVYGNEKLGLCHIIANRKKQGFTDEKIKALLDSLDDVITNGKIEPSNTGNATYEVYKEGKVAIISPTLNGNRFTFVLTAYKSRNKK